jgi:uncharacterized protein (DUF305 family)
MSTPGTSARLATGAALTLSLLLAACGGTPASPATQPPAAATAASGAPAPRAGAGYNDVDVEFAQRMIPHHQQAVGMAELAADRAGSAEVEALAEQIRAGQDQEIAQLTGLLQAWGAKLPDSGSGGSGHGGMAGMDHSQMGGTAPEQMEQLRTASGTAFDAVFLEMMVEHHRGAITDAQRELDAGADPEARQLAAKIKADQTAEIDRMRRLQAA